MPLGHSRVGFPTTGSEGGEVWKFQRKDPARTKVGRGDSLGAYATELLNVELGREDRCI